MVEAHVHRFRFPTPGKDELITGICQCGAESVGIAYETSEHVTWRNHRPVGKRRPKPEATV